MLEAEIVDIQTVTAEPDEPSEFEVLNAGRTRQCTTNILLLHSRFTDEHRRAKQERLEKELGAACWDGNTYRGSDLIIVATQVVEVGLDISVRTLHVADIFAFSLLASGALGGYSSA